MANQSIRIRTIPGSSQNIRVKLEDEATLKYSVTCPEWRYCMPTGNPHEIARQVIKCTMMHNINVIKGGDDSVEVPI